MSEITNIEWCDSTFNPWIGCTKVSPGCDHCYAERSTPSRTLGVNWGPGAERRRTSVANWNLPMRWNAQHQAFFNQHGRRQRVFCSSLADVFDNQVEKQWRDDLWQLIWATPHLDWQLLTKRIGNVMDMLPDEWGNGLVPYWPHVWIGATVVNQAEADRDIPKLLEVPAVKRFLSMEPLLGPVDLRLVARSYGFPKHITRDGRAIGMPQGLHQVIVGGESGPAARPMHPDWARSLRDQCASVGLPFLFKQWGEWGPIQYADNATGNLLLKLAFKKDEIVIGGPADGTQPLNMTRTGKKAAGRLLDGIAHDGVPA